MPSVTSFEGERVLHILNYDILSYRLEELLALGAKAVIFDESHHLKNGRSARTKAALKLAARKPVRLLLSGTPIQNRPAELLPQLQVAGRLKDLGGFWTVMTRYVGAKVKQFSREQFGWDTSGGQNLHELHERLRACCFLRRTKGQVMKEMPRKVVTRVPLGLSPDGRMRYESAANDIATWLAEKSACDAAWESTVAHLPADDREFLRAERVAAALERLDGMELLLRLGTLRQIAAEGKVPLAIEWCKELCPQRKLVLFAHHKPVVAALREGLADLGAVVIDGQTSGVGRAKAVQTFQQNAACRVLIASVTAAGTGLDGLQKAAHDVAFLEYPWTPGSLDQASSRVHRQGQEHTVHEWHLIARGTVDDELAGILASKRKVVDELTDGLEDPPLISPAEAMAGAVDIARQVAKALKRR